MIKLINELNAAKNELEEKLKVYVRDTSVPLNDRWSAFCLAELGERKRYIWDDFDTFHGTYRVDRYQTVVLLDEIQVAYENAELERDENGDYIEDSEDSEGNYVLTQEAQQRIDVTREKILKDFIWSFVYDW